MIQHVLSGIKAYGDSLSLIRKLGLWKYFAVPMLISFFIAISIGFSIWGWSDNIGHVIAKLWFWEWGKSTFTTISNILGGIFILALGLILYKHIVMALAAPFMSPVSEKIERYLYAGEHQHRKTDNVSQLWRGVRINLRNLGLELLLTIPILLLGIIPIIGIFSTILLFIVQAYYAGFGNMDYTLERHLNYSSSIDFVKKHKGYAIGNGIVFMLFLLIPVIGIILVLPLSVTAASKMTLPLLNKK